jgi:hypothetical protein
VSGARGIHQTNLDGSKTNRTSAKGKSTDPTADDMPIAANDCIVCGRWPEKDRWALREMIETLPVQEIEQICDECLMAFWQNCVVGPMPDEPNKH